MSNKALTLLLGLLALLSACSESSSKVESYLGIDISKEALDNHIQERMKELKIPGMSVAFINNGQVVHHKTFGYSNVQDSVPVTDKTIFEAASLSKPVFAYFVMQYVDRGKLDLDVPLHTYLPYPDIEHDERYKKITARMVLSHRTGFPNWRSDYPDNKLFIKFEPGTDFHYSGEGYQYLAMVLKSIDKTHWQGLENKFQSTVCQPIGMEYTVFIQDNYSIKHKAEPYDEHGAWISPQNDTDSLLRHQFRAPASVHTEAIDFSKWLIALMNKEGLSEESYDQLFRSHSSAGEFSSIKLDYTLGFYHPRIPLTNLYVHGGNNLGFTAFFALDPGKKWGYSIFTNSEYGEQLGNELLLFMLVGPDTYKLYLIVGVILLTVIALMYLGIKFLRRKSKMRKLSFA